MIIPLTGLAGYLILLVLVAYPAVTVNIYIGKYPEYPLFKNHC
jgi:hypothetical protein